MSSMLGFFRPLPELSQPQRSHFQFTPKFLRKKCCRCHSNNTGNSFPFDNHRRVRRMIEEFNPKIPIEEAITPPSSWYTDPDFYSHELNRVFYRGWQPVGYADQIKEPRDYFTGRLGSIEYVVCRDEQGKLYAFHNVCRHHASLVASGTGKNTCFVCPYHGWTYGLDGKLQRATRITGIKNFKVNEMGLVPIRVSIWGPFVLINTEEEVCSKENLDTRMVANEWLGDAAEILSSNVIDTSLHYVRRRVYTLECNWKVFCDNYLDGGYHVPYAHKGLASGLHLDSYSTKMYEKVSIQSCGGKEENGRLGSEAFYAFIFPNFMINRYGPWMDTNLALPLGPRKCLVIFDYFLDASLMFGSITQNLLKYGPFAIHHRTLQPYTYPAEGSICKEDNAFIEQSLEDSERVQDEDINLCKGVQLGIESPSYNVGRYSPTVEMSMHHFHRLLHQNLTN